MGKSSCHIVHQSILSRKWRYELPYFLPLAQSNSLTIKDKENAVASNELLSESYQKYGVSDLLELKKKRRKKRKKKSKSRRLVFSGSKSFMLKEPMKSWSGWIDKALPSPTKGFYFTQNSSGEVFDWSISDAVVEYSSGDFHDLPSEFVLFLGNWNGMCFATAGYAVVRPGNILFLHSIYLSTFSPVTGFNLIKKKYFGLFKSKRNIKYRLRKIVKLRLVQSKRRFWVFKKKFVSLINHPRRRRKIFLKKKRWSKWFFLSKLKKLRPWTSYKPGWSKKWWSQRSILISGIPSKLRWKISRKLVRSLSKRKRRFDAVKRRRLLARRKTFGSFMVKLRAAKRRRKKIKVKFVRTGPFARRRILFISNRKKLKHKKKKIFFKNIFSKKRLSSKKKRRVFKVYKRTFVLRSNVLRRRFVRLFKYFRFKNSRRRGLNFCHKLWKRGLGFSYRSMKRYYSNHFNSSWDTNDLTTSWWQMLYDSSVKVRFIRKGTKSGKIYKRVNSILHI